LREVKKDKARGGEKWLEEDLERKLELELWSRSDARILILEGLR